MTSNTPFTFEISLSVLNHLGRNLYRSFMTVLGEAISNSWDADANNVWIYIDRKAKTLVVKDDGKGMDAEDFQSKFLKIGYSKRKDGTARTAKGRPFIGRKGIGKLALLSCAKRVSVISKTSEMGYVGGIIDNLGLTEAIKDDLTPDKYALSQPNLSNLERFTESHKQGTIIHFEGLNDGIRNSLDYIKKSVALYFRFSLLDKGFNIFINDELISIDHIDYLADNTQFVWVVNDIDDPYISEKLLDNPNVRANNLIISENGIKGFIASVTKPSQLKITSTDEKVSVDLFVNGRLREKDILKHIPTTRLVESYLYGQIHYNELDGEVDRFTSSREGIVADDPKFREFLQFLREILKKVIEEWDIWRVENREDGDPENTRIAPRERKARELFNVVSQDYALPQETDIGKEVNRWVNDLGKDAEFNFSSYAECFVAENLIRRFISERAIPLTPEAERRKEQWKEAEERNKGKGNISIEIRRSSNELGYLAMDDLANLVDKRDPNKESCLARDANEYKPIRDALAHTSLLTEEARRRLTSVYDNIRGRVKALLSSPPA